MDRRRSAELSSRPSGLQRLVQSIRHDAGGRAAGALRCHIFDGTHPELTEALRSRGEGAWRLAAALVLSLAFMVAEMVAAYFSNSLALWSDSVHMMSDVTGFAISLFAQRFAQRRPSATHSFGYLRAEVLGALASVMMIWAVTGVLVWEAVGRFMHPEARGFAERGRSLDAFARPCPTSSPLLFSAESGRAHHGDRRMPGPPEQRDHRARDGKPRARTGFIPPAVQRGRAQGRGRPRRRGGRRAADGISLGGVHGRAARHGGACRGRPWRGGAGQVGERAGGLHPRDRRRGAERGRRARRRPHLAQAGPRQVRPPVAPRRPPLHLPLLHPGPHDDLGHPPRAQRRPHGARAQASASGGRAWWPGRMPHQAAAVCRLASIVSAKQP